MRWHGAAKRVPQLLFWLLLSWVGMAACLHAMSESGAESANSWINKPTDDLTSTSASSDAAVDGSCPHGALEDPHRGFIRCLEPHEVDAHWLPPKPQPDPPGDASWDAFTDVGPDAIADVQVPDATLLSPPTVEFKTPSFVNGEVPKVDKQLQKLSGGIGECVAKHGGLSGTSGSLKVQFLVRARGVAEGVEVLNAQGVSPEARRCVQLLFKHKPVGTPTADPVGVTVTISLKAVN